MTLTNAKLSELLAAAGAEADGHRRKAYERAAAAALGWDEEASEILASGRSLTELPAIGAGLAAHLEEWIEEEREPPPPPAARRGFLTRAEVRRILVDHPFADAPAADLQMHTVYSDGKATVAAMAEAASALGRSLIAVTDHSTGQPVTRGMTAEESLRQNREVVEVNEELARAGEEFRVVRGIEMNLSPSGEPALDAEERRQYPWVIGSFHSSLRGTSDQTARYLSALRSGSFHVLGHPTCRRFGRRPGLQAEWEKVFEAAAESGVAVEINAHPHRQDLPVELAEIAVAAGCMFSLGTDAHSTGELAFFDFGLAIAVAAGVPEERIINFVPAERFVELVGAA
jgi:putative hydrolase